MVCAKKWIDIFVYIREKKSIHLFLLCSKQKIVIKQNFANMLAYGS